MKQVKIIISGRVQMVGFRYFALEQARRHHITGYVRNLPDRTVEVLGQGEPEELDAFVSKLKSGPPAARVDHAALTHLPQTAASYDNFRVTR